MARPKTKKCDTCKHRKDKAAGQVCMVRRMNVTTVAMIDCKKYQRNRSKAKDDGPQLVKCSACQEETPIDKEREADAQLCNDCFALLDHDHGNDDKTDEAPAADDAADKTDDKE